MAALADVLGALILVRTHWEKRYLRYFVALGAGFMIAAVLLEMVPESFRLAFRWTPTLVLGGYCLILAEDRATAVRIAAQHPGVRVGAVEVRPLFDLSGLQQSS